MVGSDERRCNQALGTNDLRTVNLTGQLVLITVVDTNQASDTLSPVVLHERSDR